MDGVSFNPNPNVVFTQPLYAFGEVLRTQDNRMGIVVGLVFIIEDSIWQYGLYPVDGQNQMLMYEWWLDENHLSPVNSE